MPNSNQGTPEGVDEDREQNNTNALNNPANANNMGHDVAGVGQPPGPMATARRDENSISFRHFLQPHSDVVPLPAPQCRSRNRVGAQAGAVDLMDMAMTLPDFVQDHLVVESLANAGPQNDGNPSHSGASPLDLNVLNEILPDFTSQSSQAGNLRRRNVQEEPPAVPEVPHGAAGTSALPDFLSDGPMQCTDTNDGNAAMSVPSSSRSTSRILASSLTERNRLVDDSSRSTSFDSSESLRSEVERLRRELAERNRRVTQLEGEIARLRTTNNALENALRTAEQSVNESEVSHSIASGSTTSSRSRGVTINGGVSEIVESDLSVVRDIAQSSEALISQLLQNMTLLQGLTNVTNKKAGNPSKEPSSDDKNKNK